MTAKFLITAAIVVALGIVVSIPLVTMMEHEAQAYTHDYYTTHGHHHCTKGKPVPKGDGKCTFEGR